MYWCEERVNLAASLRQDVVEEFCERAAPMLRVMFGGECRQVVDESGSRNVSLGNSFPGEQQRTRIVSSFTLLRCVRGALQACGLFVLVVLSLVETPPIAYLPVKN